MLQHRAGWLALALTVTVVATVGSVRATAFAGTWTATVVFNGQEVTLCLIRVEDTDGKTSIRLLDAPREFTRARITGISGGAHELQFTFQSQSLSFSLVLSPTKASNSLRLLGSAELNGRIMPAFLEKSDKTEIESGRNVRWTLGFDELREAREERGEAKKAAILENIAKKYAGKPAELLAAEALLNLVTSGEIKGHEIKPTAERYLKAAEPYGPRMQKQAITEIAQAAARGKDPVLALTYARQAADSLSVDEPPARTVAVLRLLANSMRKAGKTEGLKALEERIAKAESALDQQFLKNAVPFTTERYQGRKGGSNRVAVLELFTGAQCPPCVAADIAFDAALKVYEPSEVVLLQYHLHIPGPDPLTNPVAEARAEFYSVDGTPNVFLDGRAVGAMGGFRPHGKDRFERLARQVNEALDTDAKAKLALKVIRKGDRIDLAAEVSGLRKTGDKVRLRFVLLEEEVRYPGTNGQRFHHHIVRALPGGVEGFALKDRTARHTASVSLVDLRKSLNDYLDRKEKEDPFPDANRPLKLDHLQAVVFIQDDESKEILQATQVEVPSQK
jgi:hypothetical protein